jgi:hypothetical protein
MRKPFDDLLDEINEIRRNVATSNDTRLERPRHVVESRARRQRRGQRDVAACFQVKAILRLSRAYVKANVANPTLDLKWTGTGAVECCWAR